MLYTASKWCTYKIEDYWSWKQQHRGKAYLNTHVGSLFDGWWAFHSESLPTAFFDDITLLRYFYSNNINFNK